MPTKWIITATMALITGCALYNGRLLAGMENANIRVVELFCLLHDTQRRNEYRDPAHGRRAARYA
ncbi:MAG: hypothetical protein HOJ18_10990 [Rhodospirillaceae bacterium]|nr:hypothetical protein [Rhodospirillaceae bacterium]